MLILSRQFVFTNISRLFLGNIILRWPDDNVRARANSGGDLNARRRGGKVGKGRKRSVTTRHTYCKNGQKGVYIKKKKKNTK